MIKTPDTYVIVFFVVLLASILTYIVPVSKFETHEIKYTQGGSEKTRTVLMPETFQIVTDESGAPVRNGLKFFESGGGVGFANYLFEGLCSGDKWGTAVGVIASILVFGGAFSIIIRTGAIDKGILAVIRMSGGKAILLIPLLWILFSLGGAVFGMGEEAMAFLMVITPLIIAMGYDAVTAVLCTYCATQVGFGSSWMNPYSVGIAQGIAQVPMYSGSPFRMVMWVFFTGLGIIVTLIYATRVKRNPKLSYSYESDRYWRNRIEEDRKKEQLEGVGKEFTTGHGLVIAVMAAGMAWVVWGVIFHEYYIPEISSQFFVTGLACGIIGAIFKLDGMGVNDIAASFRQGASDLLGAALLVGMAKGIVLVMGGSDPTMPGILNTILYKVSQAIRGFSPALCAWLMYVFHTFFNFFVVSGTGQAALTMPFMAPLSDLVGITRQVAVVAFSLGDAFSNMIVPTSGALMGALAVAKIDWARWAKFQVKWQGMLFLFGSVFVLAAFFIGL
ncbi:MAG: putative basic amino acid antiporter YfcC [Synergistaceae bacterium]|nr:putative basic amino acid antiporter YfcC [Synergistaceae bacterium]